MRRILIRSERESDDNEQFREARSEIQDLVRVVSSGSQWFAVKAIALLQYIDKDAPHYVLMPQRWHRSLMPSARIELTLRKTRVLRRVPTSMMGRKRKKN